MKILIVLLRLKGGVGRANTGIVNTLRKKGYKVDILSREDDLKIYSLVKGIFPLRKRIKQLMKKEDYDVIYTQDWSLTLPLLFPYRILKNKHFSCFCGHQENILIIIQNIVGRLMGKKLIVIGDELKERFPKSTLIYRGIDFEKFKLLKRKRDGLGWVKKGTEKIVLSEFNLLNIAKKNKLKLYVAEKIPPGKMNNFYNKCKVFVSLPLRAGYNNVWNESMAAGVPIVIGNSEGGGTVLPINKVNMKKDVYSQINKLIKNPREINNRKWLVDNGFSWDNKAEELIKFFEKTLSKNKNV